jgi:hypothetical protein
MERCSADSRDFQRPLVAHLAIVCSAHGDAISEDNAASDQN